MMVAVVVKEVVVLVDGADTVLLHKVASERASYAMVGCVLIVASSLP